MLRQPIAASPIQFCHELELLFGADMLCGSLRRKHDALSRSLLNRRADQRDGTARFSAHSAPACSAATG